MSWSPVLNKLVISNAGPLDVSDGGIALCGGISLIEADEIERAGAFEVFTAFHQHARPSGVPDGYTAIKTGLGAEVGLGTSVVWSVWEIERVEIRRIERAMLRDLDDTCVLRNQSGARFVYAKIGSRPTDRDSHPVNPVSRRWSRCHSARDDTYPGRLGYRCVGCVQR